MCCSGTKASFKKKVDNRRQRKEKQKMMETMGEMETGTVRS